VFGSYLAFECLITYNICILISQNINLICMPYPPLCSDLQFIPLHSYGTLTLQRCTKNRKVVSLPFSHKDNNVVNVIPIYMDNN